MSNTGQQIFSSLTGNHSLESKLQSIRGKLSEINRAVRRLESNIIFLLVNPELITYTSSQNSDSNNQQFTESLNTNEQSSMLMSIPRTDYGQEQFIIDPVELNGQYAEQMGIRHSLMVSESEISDTLYEQKKKMYHDSIASDEHYSNDNNHSFL